MLPRLVPAIFCIGLSALAQQQPRTVTTTSYPAVPVPGHAYTGPTSPAFAAQSSPSIVKQPATPLTAPLFLENSVYTSDLHLVNSLQLSVQANVTVYDKSGTVLTKKSLSLDPNSQRTVGIGGLLQEAGVYAQLGSVEVLTPGNESAVLGQVSITRAGASKAFLEEELFMPDPGDSRTLRAVVDSASSSPVVALTSLTSSDSQTLHVRCVRSSGEVSTRTLTLQPRQMKLVRACDAQAEEVSSADAVESAQGPISDAKGRASAAGAGGCSITTDGLPNQMAAFGFAQHEDKFGSYLSAMNFSDPGALHSPNFIFSGVPVGASKLLPGENYVPQVIVANFADVERKVDIVFATTTGENSQAKQVASFSMPPNSSKLVSLPELQGDADWQNSFAVHSNGQPGEVIAKMTFKAAGLLPNIELLAKDEQHWQNFGDHPWSVENGTKSTLLLYNHDVSTRTVTVRVGSGASVWLKMYTLQPNETKAISINDLIGSETPDDKGQTISKKEKSGEAGWFAPSSGAAKVSGRMVQIAADGSSARNFSCYIGSGLCSLTLEDNPLDLVTLYNDTDRATAAYCTYQGPPNGCANNGQYTAMSTPLNYSWSSGSSSIASIVSGGATNTATWHGVSGGNTTSYLNVQVQNNTRNACVVNGGVNVFSATVTGESLSQGTVGVNLSGPSSAVGALTVSLVGSSNTYTVAYGSGSVGPGSYTVTLNRPAIAADLYSSVKVDWKVASQDVSGSTGIKWKVLGLIRHSQYNTPAENSCSGSPNNAWIINLSSCSFKPISLRSDFISQVYINGTGVSGSYGILKYTPGTKNQCAYPAGANDSNTFLQVSSITGSCNTMLDTSSVATNPNPVTDVTTFGCHDNLSLVTSANQLQSPLKFPEDFCFACNSGFNGTNGHIDNYSSNPSCSGHSVGDYGNFWTADSYTTN